MELSKLLGAWHKQLVLSVLDFFVLNSNHMVYKYRSMSKKRLWKLKKKSHPKRSQGNRAWPRRRDLEQLEFCSAFPANDSILGRISSLALNK